MSDLERELEAADLGERCEVVGCRNRWSFCDVGEGGLYLCDEHTPKTGGGHERTRREGLAVDPSHPVSGTTVRATDNETGESEEVVITNDYVIVADGTCTYSVQAHANGTHVIMVKGRGQS